MFTIDDEKAKQVLKGFQIPAKPEVLTQIQVEQQKKYPDLNRIAEIISSDIGLSANVLKAINSPVFGLGRTVTDIQQSVMMLGVQNVINLVTFHKMRDLLTGKSSIPLEPFWDSAVETARMMVAALNQLDLKRDCPAEDAYALGLLHNCGLAMMATRFNDYNLTLNEANTLPDEEVTEIEENHYETDHTTVGYFVSTSWNLPENICTLILRHHDNNFLTDESVDDSMKDLYGILHIAKNVLNNYHTGENHISWHKDKDNIFFHFSLSEHDYEELEADIIDEFEAL